MAKSRGETRQASINAICKYFVTFNIQSTHDLSIHFAEIVNQINKNPNIFRSSDSPLHRVEIFSAAINAYAYATELQINIPSDADLDLFKQMTTQDASTQTVHDLSKVTQSYDQLTAALNLNRTTNNTITAILQKKDYGVCDTIILGAGDTGTTLWLEKYKANHRETYAFLAKKTLPSVLMVSDGYGNWAHDYTLAQTQSSLERSNADMNPSDFMSTEYYKKNPQANARHVFQANQVCLGQTHAPILQSNVLKIEKKSNHKDWQDKGSEYRLIVELPKEEIKKIYTNNIEICTGLGAANIAFDEKVIQSEEVKKLNQFDSQLGFTPIVDGNQFVLSDSEEKDSNRTIVIYGGGGTASACYRKCFFGTDIRTYDRPYTPDNQKNEVTWIFKDFIGTGKMAMNALKAAEERNEVFHGELIKIKEESDKQIALTFKIQKSDQNTEEKEFVCDQLVYSIGQNDLRAREVCGEVGSNLELHSDKSGMLLYISTEDQKVRYFGAAAVIFNKNEFLSQTMKWLNEQNIGGDVGAGSMPPTRAQIKSHLALQNVKPESINANMDTSTLIKEFLVDAGIKTKVADHFIRDILAARKHDTSGCTHEMLKSLMSKHTLDATLEIYGHSHLVVKGQKKLKSKTREALQDITDSKKQFQPIKSADDSRPRSVTPDNLTSSTPAPTPQKTVSNKETSSPRMFREVTKKDNLYLNDEKENQEITKQSAFTKFKRPR